MKDDSVLRCPHCGREMLFEDEICPYCGEEISGPVRREKNPQSFESTLNPTQEEIRASQPAQNAGKAKRLKPLQRVKIIVLVGFIALTMGAGLFRTVRNAGRNLTAEQESAAAIAETTGTAVEPTEMYFVSSAEECDAIDEDAFYRHPKRWEQQGWDLSKRELETMRIAANHAAAWHRSRAGLMAKMKEQGYRNPKKVEKALDRLDIDFRIIALKSLFSYLSVSDFSPEEMRNQLEYEQFTPEEIQYAMDHARVDWKAQMESRCRQMLEEYPYSRWGLIQRLTEKGFDPKEVETHVDSLQIDCRENAVRAGRERLELGEIEHNELQKRLQREGFSFDDAAYAADTLCP